MTATQPIAVLRGAAPDLELVGGAHRTLLRTGGTQVSTTSGAPPPTNIVFGTDGWRARIADEYTFENVRRCADGVAHTSWSVARHAKGVVIAYDRRFGSEHFAAAAAEVILAYGIPVALSSRAVPTQMSSYEVVQRGSAAGIVITASHNPWMDNGFKVKAPTGAAAGADMLSGIEARLRANGGSPSSGGRSRMPRPPASSSGSIPTTATSSSSAGPWTSMRCAPPTSASSSTRCGVPGRAG